MEQRTDENNAENNIPAIVPEIPEHHLLIMPSALSTFTWDEHKNDENEDHRVPVPHNDSSTCTSTEHEHRTTTSQTDENEDNHVPHKASSTCSSSSTKDEHHTATSPSSNYVDEDWQFAKQLQAELDMEGSRRDMYCLRSHKKEANTKCDER